VDGLKDRIERALPPVIGGAVRVRELRPLFGGACQDNFRVDVEVDGADEGFYRLVLRSDAAALPRTLGRRDEFEVMRAAHRAGVRTPRARWCLDSVVRDGAAAIFMDWADGVAIGAKVVRDPSLAEARRGLAAELAVELARTHAVDPARLPLRSVDDPVAAALRDARELMDELPSVHAAAALAYRKLRDDPPPGREVVLTHGDFRTGNFLVGPSGLSAVLDWEFARLSHPADDIAWLCVRDWRFGQLDLEAGGFARREDFVAAYQRASGRRIDRRDLRWWEAMGNLRWALGCAFQAKRYEDGSARDLELLAIGRRAAEMEWEALRVLGEAD
jgi:aminoglycoside phosphotransferase (APT) family kinase protein